MTNSGWTLTLDIRVEKINGCELAQLGAPVFVRVTNSTEYPMDYAAKTNFGDAVTARYTLTLLPSVYTTYDTLKLWLFYDQDTTKSPAVIASGYFSLSELVTRRTVPNITLKENVFGQTSVVVGVSLVSSEPGDDASLQSILGMLQKSALHNAQEMGRRMHRASANMTKLIEECLPSVDDGSNTKEIDQLDPAMVNLDTCHIFSDMYTFSTQFTSEMRITNCRAVPSAISLYALSTAFVCAGVDRFDTTTTKSLTNTISVLQHYAAFLNRIKACTYSSDTTFTLERIREGMLTGVVRASEAFFTPNLEQETDDCDGLAQVAVAFLDRLYTIGKLFDARSSTGRQKLKKHADLLKKLGDTRPPLDLVVELPDGRSYTAGNPQSQGRMLWQELFTMFATDGNGSTDVSDHDLLGVGNMLEETTLKKAIAFAVKFAEAVGTQKDIHYGVVCMAASAPRADCAPDTDGTKLSLAGHATCLMRVRRPSNTGFYHIFIENTSNECTLPDGDESVIDVEVEKSTDTDTASLTNAQHSAYWTRNGQAHTKVSLHKSTVIAQISTLFGVLFKKIIETANATASINICAYTGIQDCGRNFFFQKLYTYDEYVLFVVEQSNTNNCGIHFIDNVLQLRDYKLLEFGVSLKELCECPSDRSVIAVRVGVDTICKLANGIDTDATDTDLKAYLENRCEEILLPPSDYCKYTASTRSWPQIDTSDKVDTIPIAEDVDCIPFRTIFSFKTGQKYDSTAIVATVQGAVEGIRGKFSVPVDLHVLYVADSCLIVIRGALVSRALIKVEATDA